MVCYRRDNQIMTSFIEAAGGNMVRTFMMALAIIACAGAAMAQTSGNMTYSQSDGSAGSRARQNERNKRVPVPGEIQADGMFLEASVLMNVLADEYVAVFGVSQECATVAECSQKIDAVISEF